MNFFFLHLPTHKMEDPLYQHRMVTIHRSPNDYTDEGSEFLDDAIRMKDQPLGYPAQIVALGITEPQSSFQ